MIELDYFVLANAGRIPCTVRTIRPYSIVGPLKPWVTLGEIASAVDYLCSRSEMQEQDRLALKELFEKLRSSLMARQAEENVDRREETADIDEQ